MGASPSLIYDPSTPNNIGDEYKNLYEIRYDISCVNTMEHIFKDLLKQYGTIAKETRDIKSSMKTVQQSINEVKGDFMVYGRGPINISQNIDSKVVVKALFMIDRINQLNNATYKTIYSTVCNLDNSVDAGAIDYTKDESILEILNIKYTDPKLTENTFEFSHTPPELWENFKIHVIDFDSSDEALQKARNAIEIENTPQSRQIHGVIVSSFLDMLNGILSYPTISLWCYCWFCIFEGLNNQVLLLNGNLSEVARLISTTYVLETTPESIDLMKRFYTIIEYMKDKNQDHLVEKYLAVYKILFVRCISDRVVFPLDDLFKMVGVLYFRNIKRLATWSESITKNIKSSMTIAITARAMNQIEISGNFQVAGDGINIDQTNSLEQTLIFSQQMNHLSSKLTNISNSSDEIIPSFPESYNKYSTASLKTSVVDKFLIGPPKVEYSDGSSVEGGEYTPIKEETPKSKQNVTQASSSKINIKIVVTVIIILCLLIIAGVFLTIWLKNRNKESDDDEDDEYDSEDET
jgi:hypothetical protein